MQEGARGDNRSSRLESALTIRKTIAFPEGPSKYSLSSHQGEGGPMDTLSWKGSWERECISFLLLLKQIVINLVALINTSLLSHSSKLRIKYGSHSVKIKVSAWLSSFLECLGDSLFPVHLCCWQNQFLTMVRLSFSFSCWL